MKTVPVSKGYFAFVDDEDYDLVIQFKWHVVRGGRNTYAATIIGGRKVLMHRLILRAAKGTMIDHADNEGLNNQKSNLRRASYFENFQNARPKRTKGRTSRFKGVWRIKSRCRRCWRAGITANGVRRNIGTYVTEVEAARAYDALARVLHGEFAWLNFQDQKQGGAGVPTSPPVAPDQPKADEAGSAANARPRSRRPRCGKCRRPRRR